MTLKHVKQPAVIFLVLVANKRDNTQSVKYSDIPTHIDLRLNMCTGLDYLGGSYIPEVILGSWSPA